MFKSTIGFKHLSFSELEDAEEEAVTPPSPRSEATGGKLLFTTPSSTASGLTGGQGAGIYQMCV